MLASIYFSSFCLAVKVNENPTMGGDGDGEEVTFEEGDDVEEEDADIDAVSVLLIMIDYVQISSQWTALETLKQWKLKLGANEVGWGGGGGGRGAFVCYIDGEVQMKPNCYTFRKLQVVWT